MDPARRSLASLLVALAVPATTAAAPVPVVNAGFETPAQATMGAFEVLTPPGWSVHDPHGLIGEDTGFGVWWPRASFDYASVPEGMQVGYVFADLAPGAGELGLRQTLPAALGAGTRVSFDVGVGDPTDDSDVLLAGFPGYRVELWAGDALVASEEDTPGVEGQFRFARATAPIGAAHPGLGQPLELRLLNANAAAGAEVDFDAVTVDVSPAPIESYRFRVADAGGSLEGVLVYDRAESAATQPFDSDAALTITSATGDLAPFAAGEPGAGMVNAAGGVLTVTALAGQHFLTLFFTQPVTLAQPLPLAAFQPANTDAYVNGIQVFDGAAQGATVELPEPAGAGAAAALALAALAARSPLSSSARSAPASPRGACSGRGRRPRARRGAGGRRR
ncbi:MAG TPA: hypothetical protein VLC53_11580 [Myxococcota bacterium]|nr:hypothetical protein [Myxococcota bacterium]